MQEHMRLLTIQEAAARMGVHRNTISKWLQMGWLRAIGGPGSARIPIENLDGMQRPRRGRKAVS